MNAIFFCSPEFEPCRLKATGFNNPRIHLTGGLTAHGFPQTRVIVPVPLSTPQPS